MPGSDYYDHTTYPSTGAAGSSAALRAELDLIEAGFGKLPGFSGNGSKIVAVNSGATALEALTTTGTGSGVRATSPTLTTPVLGVATATSINKVALTAPAAGATLTLADGSTLATAGAYSVTFTATAATALTLPTTGTLATLAGSETLTNKTIDASNNTFIGVITATSTTTLTNKTIAKADNTLTGVAGSGANSDITSLSGLTTPLSVAQGGTGGATANAARANLLQLPPVRQTVLFGPVDSSGLPDFGGSTGSTTVTATGTLTPTTANGISGDRIGSITDPSWTGLSTNGTMYLYLDIAAAGTCTTGSTTLAPVYQKGGTYSTTSGQFTFNTQEMTGKVGDGAAAAQTHRVFVGEVTVAGNVVTAITWYALMGRYESAASGLTFGANTSYNHNIGTSLVHVDGILVCTTTELGYAVGDEAHNWGATVTSNYGATVVNTSRNSAVFSINSGGPLLTNRSTFVTSNITAASWDKKIIVRRRF